MESLQNDLVGARNDGCKVSGSIRKLMSKEIFLERFSISLDATDYGQFASSSILVVVVNRKSISRSSRYKVERLFGTSSAVSSLMDGLLDQTSQHVRQRNK